MVAPSSEQIILPCTINAATLQGKHYVYFRFGESTLPKKFPFIASEVHRNVVHPIQPNFHRTKPHLRLTSKSGPHRTVQSKTNGTCVTFFFFFKYSADDIAAKLTVD